VQKWQPHSANVTLHPTYAPPPRSMEKGPIFLYRAFPEIWQEIIYVSVHDMTPKSCLQLFKYCNYDVSEYPSAQYCKNTMKCTQIIAPCVRIVSGWGGGGGQKNWMP